LRPFTAFVEVDANGDYYRKNTAPGEQFIKDSRLEVIMEFGKIR